MSRARRAVPLLGVIATAWSAVAGAAALDKAYRKCPGNDILASAVDVAWSPQESAIARHREFRAKKGLTVPEGETRILWFASGGDLGTTTFSVTAVRRQDGIWHVDGVGETQIWIKDTPPTPMPPLNKDLSLADSRALDGMIADRCLLRGPTFQRDPHIVAGGLISTLEIETPKHRWIGGWWGDWTPQEGAITNLLGR